MAYIIWHKMSWTIAIWVSKEPYESDKCNYEKIFYTFLFILRCKMQKPNGPHFSLYFWAAPFANLKSKVGTLKLIQSSIYLAFYTSIDQNNGKKSRNRELSNFFYFWTTLTTLEQSCGLNLIFRPRNEVQGNQYLIYFRHKLVIV